MPIRSRYFRIDGKFEKFDETLGLAMGWAIVCTEDGKDYFDLQGDHVPDESMLKEATDFMLNSQAGQLSHSGERAATVVFAWPMTQEVAKAFGIETSRTGLMIAFKPDDPREIEKFRSGEYTGFSIGGTRGTDEEVD